jgi:hypothetical protein
MEAWPTIGFALVLLCGNAPARAINRASVGLSALSPTNGTVWVAEEKGLFKKYGTPLDEAQGERLST